MNIDTRENNMQPGNGAAGLLGQFRETIWRPFVKSSAIFVVSIVLLVGALVSMRLLDTTGVMTAVERWRSGLFSVFVQNVSRRISKSSLWEAFNSYGNVLDVYISFYDKMGKPRSVTFAFVRFKLESESQKAIEEGNNRLMDGRAIRVSMAKYKRRLWSRTESGEGDKIRSSPTRQPRYRSRDDRRLGHCRSFKEALLDENISSFHSDTERH
ncbi:hypothetical protein REPUB_Repub15cG0032000 [Reevesia pubescens]